MTSQELQRMSDYDLLFLAHLKVRVKNDRITIFYPPPPATQKDVFLFLYVKEFVKHIQRWQWECWAYSKCTITAEASEMYFYKLWYHPKHFNLTIGYKIAHLRWWPCFLKRKKMGVGGWGYLLLISFAKYVLEEICLLTFMSNVYFSPGGK